MNLATFSPHLRTVSGVLNAAGTGYYIPLYQRPYRWKKRNVQRLIFEIIDGIARFHTGRASSTFLGTTILVQDRESCVPQPVKWPNTVFHVIDGQQRIATLMAICGELHREITNHLQQLQPMDRIVLEPVATRQLAALEASLSVRLRDSGTESLPRMIRGKADIWGHSYASPIAQYLSRFADGHNGAVSTGDTLFDRCLKTIQDTLISEELFHSRIADIDGEQWANLFSEQPPNEIPSSDDAMHMLRFLTFAAFMMNGVQIIVVEADSGTSASSVFEPLNTTGEDLTAFETFVPLVVYKCGGDQGYIASPEALELARFDELLLQHYPIDAATRTKRALVTFALADTGYKLGQDPQAQRSYLRRYLSLDDREKSIFLEGLGDTADFLRKFWYGSPVLSAIEGRVRTKVALAMLVDSKHTIPQALLVRAYRACLDASATTVNYEALFDLVEVIADFWVLWRLSRATTDNVDSHYRNLMAGHMFDGSSIGPYAARASEPRETNRENIAQDFRKILHSQGKIKDMKSWIDMVLNVDHGSQSNGTLVRYALLTAYHDTHAKAERPPYFSTTITDVSQTLTPTWYNTALTIEHIAPQSQETDDGFADEIYSEGHLHRLGNLTLVPQKENSVLGNKPWSEKRQYYRVFAQTDRDRRAQQARDLALKPETVKLLMKNYLPFCLDLARYSNRKKTWNVNDIRRRGTGLAQRIWYQVAPSMGFENPLC